MLELVFEQTKNGNYQESLKYNISFAVFIEKHEKLNKHETHNRLNRFKHHKNIIAARNVTKLQLKRSYNLD